MNSLSKFYALTLSFAATVVATTPATAANLGLFEVSGTGLSSNNVEQQIGGTFNADFSNFDIAVTTFYSPTNPSSSGTSTTSTQNYNRTRVNSGSRPIVDGNILLAVIPSRDPVTGVRFAPSNLVLSSPGTFANDFANLEVGQSFFGSWSQESRLVPSFNGGGQLTVTAVPEPGEILGVLAAGAMLGGAFLKRRMN